MYYMKYTLLYTVDISYVCSVMYLLKIIVRTCVLSHLCFKTYSVSCDQLIGGAINIILSSIWALIVGISSTIQVHSLVLSCIICVIMSSLLIQWLSSYGLLSHRLPHELLSNCHNTILSRICTIFVCAGDAWNLMRNEFARRALFRMQEQLMETDEAELVLKKRLGIKLMVS